MLGILDEQFVVRRVGQLARWDRDNRQQNTRGNDRLTRRPQGQPAQPEQAARPAYRLNPRDPAQFVERELLKLALQHPALVSPAFDNYGEDEFPTPPYTAVRRAIAQAGGAAYGATLADFTKHVRETAPDDQVRSLVTELIVEPVRTRRKPDEIYAGEFLVKLRQQAVDRRVAEVRAQLQRLGNRAAPEELHAVQTELWQLQQYGQQLRSRGSAAL